MKAAPILRRLLLCLLIVLSGCTTTSRLPYTAADVGKAQLVGFDMAVRAFGDEPPEKLADSSQWMIGTPGKDATILAISGGGSGGAFAVGALSAWSLKGDRPAFDVVTGVSTGALIAPFAFLGSRYDPTLRILYLSGAAENLVDINWQGLGFFGTSLLKGEALRKMISKYITPEVVAAIAAEHRKGRRLFVVTTDLDAERPVIWNMGAIANSTNPDAIALFRAVLVASASVPGVFPAVRIHAYLGGRNITELHSDGGTSSQLFALPDYALASRSVKTPGNRRLHIYVIVNNALIPEFEMTKDDAFSVAKRAYAMLIKSQTRQSLFALYNFAQRSKTEIHFAAIENSVPYSMLNPFDKTYMNSVFKIGYSTMSDGIIWKDRPIF